MAEEQDERGFSVNDRRFSARPESEPERPRQAPEARPSSSEERGGGAQTHSSPPTDSPPDEIDFGSFVISLGTQAFMHLGDIPNPVTQKREKDITAAKHMIDLLTMLQGKTKGNLTGDEERLLQQLLFDLRMRYVREARR